MKKILIIGAASAIARETAKHFASDGDSLFLVDINKERVEDTKYDILARFKTEISVDELDVNDFDRHQEIFDKAVKTLNGLDIVFIAHGTLPNQEQAQENISLIQKELSTNCVSVIALSSIAANYFENKQSGTIAVISSVAGDRGRQSNYIYGAAKGSVSIFLQGLRNRLSKSNVKVITIKPGMVDTPMTANMPKNPLFAKPQDVGRLIYKSINSGKEIAYVPGYWRLIMLIIKLIPEFIFKKMSL